MAEQLIESLTEEFAPDEASRHLPRGGPRAHRAQGGRRDRRVVPAPVAPARRQGHRPHGRPRSQRQGGQGQRDAVIPRAAARRRRRPTRRRRADEAPRPKKPKPPASASPPDAGRATWRADDRSARRSRSAIAASSVTQPRQGPVPARRVHQGAGDRLLRADRADDAAPHRRSWRDVASMARTASRAVVLREALPVASSRVDADVRSGPATAAASSTTAASTRSRRSRGAPTWPRSRSTRRWPAAADIESPTMVVFDLDPGCAGHDRRVLRRSRSISATCSTISVSTPSRRRAVRRACSSTSRSTRRTPTSTRRRSRWRWRNCSRSSIPTASSSVMAKAVRAGKVFVDWSQNSRHKTTIAPYSLRAMDRPTVSTPITWDEVDAPAPEASRLIFDAARRARAGRADAATCSPTTVTLEQQLPNPPSDREAGTAAGSVGGRVDGANAAFPGRNLVTSLRYRGRDYALPALVRRAAAPLPRGECSTSAAARS